MRLPPCVSFLWGLGFIVWEYLVIYCREVKFSIHNHSTTLFISQTAFVKLSHKHGLKLNAQSAFLSEIRVIFHWISFTHVSHCLKSHPHLLTIWPSWNTQALASLLKFLMRWLVTRSRVQTTPIFPLVCKSRVSLAMAIDNC